jgi:hypothetical protein
VRVVFKASAAIVLGVPALGASGVRPGRPRTTIDTEQFIVGERDMHVGQHCVRLLDVEIG